MVGRRGDHRGAEPGVVVTAGGALVERLWALIPADTVELAAAEDGVQLLDRPDLPAVHAMLALANRIVPFPEQTG